MSIQQMTSVPVSAVHGLPHGSVLALTLCQRPTCHALSALCRSWHLLCCASLNI